MRTAERTPFDSLQDLADELLDEATSALRALARNSQNRITTGEIWDSLRGTEITVEQIERGMCEELSLPSVPCDEVLRHWRIARACAAAPVERRAAFYDRLAAFDAERVRRTLAGAVDAQAASCLAGDADGWILGEPAYRTALALAQLEDSLDWRPALGRLETAVRDRVVERVTGTATVITTAVGAP